MCVFPKWAPHFLHCFPPCLRDGRKKNGPRGPFSGFWKPPGTFENAERPISGRQVLSVFVESAMECQMRVNDVFYFENLSVTMRSAISMPPEKSRLDVLLDAHAFGVPSSPWRKAPLPIAPTQNACKHLAVICVDVQCGKTCCFVPNVIAGGMFHQKGAQN